MQRDLLRIYLNDHLALIVGELQLAERCFRSNSKQEELGRFLMKLVGDLRIERQIVEELIRQSGARPDLVKQGTAWLAEKFGRLKMNGSWLEYSNLSRLLEMETLEVAARERLAFWENVELALEADTHDEIKTTGLARYRAEAAEHCRELSTHRLEAARIALTKAPREPAVAPAHSTGGDFACGKPPAPAEGGSEPSLHDV